MAPPPPLTVSWRGVGPASHIIYRNILKSATPIWPVCKAKINFSLICFHFIVFGSLRPLPVPLQYAQFGTRVAISRARGLTDSTGSRSCSLATLVSIH
ncbi:hypothetical protein J6590_010244 [Homalodisca vitripennis]|nr:hypothetical protein J6590_010244 [Homalodisca vitripennis]